MGKIASIFLKFSRRPKKIPKSEFYNLKNTTSIPITLLWKCPPPPPPPGYNNQSPNWKTVLFVETTELFISNGVRVYRYICELILLYSPRVGLLTSCFVPRGGFLYTMIVPGRVFAPFKSCPEGLSRGGGGGRG